MSKIDRELARLLQAADRPPHEPLGEWAHGYVLESLERWGRRQNDVRLFAKQVTGWFKQSSSALHSKRGGGGSDNSEVIDEIYIRMSAAHRAIMVQHFVKGRSLTQEQNALYLNLTQSGYSRRLQRVVDSVARELIRSADQAA